MSEEEHPEVLWRLMKQAHSKMIAKQRAMNLETMRKRSQTLRLNF